MHTQQRSRGRGDTNNQILLRREAFWSTQNIMAKAPDRRTQGVLTALAYTLYKLLQTHPRVFLRALCMLGCFQPRTYPVAPPSPVQTDTTPSYPWKASQVVWKIRLRAASIPTINRVTKPSLVISISGRQDV